MSNDFLKKYDQFKTEIPKRIDEEFSEQDLEEVYSSLSFIGEGFIMDIKRLGIWKGLKLQGVRVLKNVTDFFNKNPEVRKAIKGSLERGGREAMEDMSTVVGELSKKYEEKIADLESRLKRYEK